MTLYLRQRLEQCSAPRERLTNTNIRQKCCGAERGEVQRERVEVTREGRWGAAERGSADGEGWGPGTPPAPRNPLRLSRGSRLHTRCRLTPVPPPPPRSAFAATNVPSPSGSAPGTAAPFRPLFNDFGPPSMGYVQAMKPPGAQGSQSTYTDLLSVIEEMGKEVRPTYAGSKSAMERLKRGIIHARALVRECLAETERNART
uniref:Cyclin dependent kinase 2 associated protein 2 n=2 Tax=Monotremata TaxID=9255 RepID=A0A6I8P0J5_ORNAN